MGSVAREGELSGERPYAGRREGYLNPLRATRRERKRARTSRGKWRARRSADDPVEHPLAMVLYFHGRTHLTVDVGGKPNRRMLHPDLTFPLRRRGRSRSPR